MRILQPRYQELEAAPSEPNSAGTVRSYEEHSCCHLPVCCRLGEKNSDSLRSAFFTKSSCGSLMFATPTVWLNDKVDYSRMGAATQNLGNRSDDHSAGRTKVAGTC